MNRVQYWLKDNKDVYVQLPVNPSGISIPTEYGVNTIDVLALGQISMQEQPLLKRFSLEVLFPRDHNPSYCEYSGFPLPHEWVELIEKWRVARHNIRIIVTGTTVSIPVFIDSVEWEIEKAGMPGDITAKISFVEFATPRKSGMAERDKKGVLQPPKIRPSTPIEKPRSIIVGQRDSLYNIADKYYGNGGKLIDIYNANRKLFPEGLSEMPVGQRLVLP